MSTPIDDPVVTTTITKDRVDQQKTFPQSRLFVPSLVVFGLLLGMCVISPFAVGQLLFGWLFFPLNRISRMTVDGPSLLVGALAVVLFLVTLHFTLRWIGRAAFPNLSSAKPFPRLRTTFACGSGLLLLFAAGIAMVGATHQLVWLAASDAPRSTELTDDSSLSGFLTEARAQARRSQMKNTLKSFGLTMHNLHDAYNEFPPGGTIDSRGRRLHGWAIHLGGYMTYTYQGIDFQTPWNESPNAEKFRCALPDFINPAIPQVFDRDGYGLSHIAGNVHVLPITRVDRTSPSGDREVGPRSLLEAARSAPDATRRDLPLRFADFRDGTSNTMFIGQSAGNYKPWGHPTNVREPALGLGTSPDGFGGPPGSSACLFLMCDGSVRSIGHNVDRSVLKALSTPHGNEKVDLPSE